MTQEERIRGRTQETKWEVDLSEAFLLLSKSLLLLRLETVLSTYARSRSSNLRLLLYFFNFGYFFLSSLKRRLHLTVAKFPFSFHFQFYEFGHPCTVLEPHSIYHVTDTSKPLVSQSSFKRSGAGMRKRGTSAVKGNRNLFNVST